MFLPCMMAICFIIRCSDACSWPVTTIAGLSDSRFDTCGHNDGLGAIFGSYGKVGLRATHAGWWQFATEQRKDILKLHVNNTLPQHRGLLQLFQSLHNFNQLVRRPKVHIKISKHARSEMPARGLPPPTFASNSLPARVCMK